MSMQNPHPIDSQEWWEAECHLLRVERERAICRNKHRVLHSLEPSERWRLYALRAYNRGRIAEAICYSRAAGEAMYRVSPTGPKIRSVG